MVELERFPMKVAIGADHAGFALKQKLVEVLRRKGHEVTDFGAKSAESTDYPDYAAAVARAVVNQQADRGILLCMTGAGMSIAANKLPGVRAALGVSPDEVRLIRSHNDANVLTLGAMSTDPETAETLTDIFLSTEFEGGRHARRLGKISALEQGAGGEQAGGHQG
jgi:ribose 5-phosphate isomerase B